MTLKVHMSEIETRVRKTYFKFRPFLGHKNEISIRRRLFQIFCGCLFDYAAVAMIAAGKSTEWQMKYRKWFRKFSSIGANVSNRITEHIMGTVIYKRWETLYNIIAEKVDSQSTTT